MLMSKLCCEAQKKYYLMLAQNNIQTLSRCESALSIPCPDEYIGEFISGRMMPMETFEALK